MGNILGLDVGDRYIGVAVADADGTFVFPLETLERAQSRAEREILKIITERNVILIVAGLPLNDDGTESGQCASVRTFCRRLERRAEVALEYHDEFGSSLEAETELQLMGARPAKGFGAGSIDAQAAAAILRSWFRNRDAVKARSEN